MMIGRRFERKKASGDCSQSLRYYYIRSTTFVRFFFFYYFSGYRRWERLDLFIWSDSIIFAMDNAGH